MQSLWARTLAWWDDLGPRQRRTVNALSLCIVGYIAHFLVFTVSQPFYIEDAGISFAYARNLVEGHGLVTFIGGERVEGYSNPTWTFLIALFYLLKVSPWVSSKVLGAVFGAITLPLVWAITRRARGGIDDLVNVAPAFLLAASTQFVLWNASGLENSVFCVLLAAGMYRTIREGTDGGHPWSALLWFLLAITRPEGAMYGLLGFLALVIFRSHRAYTSTAGTAGERVVRGVLLPLLAWLAVFAIPLVLYHWWRYTYFSWEYPATYYAKLGSAKRFRPFSWDIRGWGYAKKYMAAYWIAWVVPLFFFATAGLGRKRGVIGLTLLAIFGIMVLWDGKGGPFSDWDFWTPVRRKWIVYRCWSIYGGAVLLGLLTLGRRGWQALSMTWGAYCAAMFFNIYVGGDWMDGFRWASLWVVPQSILLGLGLGALVERLPRLTWRPCRYSPTLRTLLVAAGTLAIAAPNAWGSYDFVIRPETGVRDVNRRVQYMTWVQERLHIDRITVLDVDMGAHMWFSGWRIMDIAGLVDIRMGHHNYQKDFMREYIFQEMKPDFVHSHGGWSRKTKINNFPEFKREYIEIPGYPAGRKAFHMGNHVARRHLTTSRYDGPMGRQVTFEGGVTLAGWAIPSPQVPVEGKFHLQTWWKAEDRETGFRMLVFLADEDGHVRVQDAGAGYDFLPVEHWRDEEWVYGHYDIEIPEDFPRGDYKVGLVLLDEETGQVMLASRATGQPSLGPNDPDGSPATAKPRRYKLARQRHVEDAGSQDSAEPNTPAPRDQPTVYMQGELILDASLAVVTRKQALEQAANDFELALHKATQGNCEESWAAWKDAKRHVIRNTRWHNDNVPAVNSAIARCYVDRASHEQDRFAQAELYKLAALHQYDAPVLLAAARPLAAQLMQEGEAFRQEKDWESCYKYFDTAVGIDPRLSMARRRAEECRDWRLDIPGADRKVEKKPSSKSKKKTGTKNGKTTRTSRSSKKNKNEEPEENQEADDQATPPASPRPERTIKVDIKETDPARDRPFPPGGMPPLPHVLDPTHGPPPGPVPEPTEQAEPVEGPEAG